MIVSASRLGEAMLGSWYLGVIPVLSKWRTVIAKLGWSITRKRRSTGSRDSYLGSRLPIFEDETITGRLVEQGGSVDMLPPGVSIRQDAVLWTADPVKEHDRILDSDRLYDVGPVEIVTDRGYYGYRIAHLSRIDLHLEY